MYKLTIYSKSLSVFIPEIILDNNKYILESGVFTSAGDGEVTYTYLPEGKSNKHSQSIKMYIKKNT